MFESPKQVSKLIRSFYFLVAALIHGGAKKEEGGLVRGAWSAAHV